MTNLQKYLNNKVLKNLQDTKQFAKEFLAEVRSPAPYLDGKADRNVILLQGELGVGKTTFSQFLLEAIGAEGPFTSPTFVIMKKYEICRGKFCSDQVAKPSDLVATKPIVRNIYHLDCYRVNEESVLDLGWEEIVADKNNLILVEWPERIKKIWPKNYWLLKFKYGKSVKNGRIVEVDMV